MHFSCWCAPCTCLFWILFLSCLHACPVCGLLPSCVHLFRVKSLIRLFKYTLLCQCWWWSRLLLFSKFCVSSHPRLFLQMKTTPASVLTPDTCSGYHSYMSTRNITFSTCTCFLPLLTACYNSSFWVYILYCQKIIIINCQWWKISDMHFFAKLQASKVRISLHFGINSSLLISSWLS